MTCNQQPACETDNKQLDILFMNNQRTTSPLQNRPRCYAKSPTVQDAFRPIPGLISCAGVTGRWGLLYACVFFACKVEQVEHAFEGDVIQCIFILHA